MKLPKLYKKYTCYDEGDKNKHKKYQVLITDIIPFEEANSDIKRIWNYAKEDYAQYALETDYFIYAISYEWWYPLVQIFVRDINNNWFGLGQWHEYESEFDPWFCHGLLMVEE